MSEITRTEKFLRACIDGEPCALKPLTRVEKLLAELNETLAGGPSEVVILPETEIVVNKAQGFITTPLSATPTDGATAKVTYNGTEYPCTVARVEENDGIGYALGNLDEMGLSCGNPDAPFVVILMPDGMDGVYGVVMLMEEVTTVTLSIVQTEGGDSSADAGGGTFIVEAVSKEQVENTDNTVKQKFSLTLNKSYAETLTAFKAGKYVAIDVPSAIMDGDCTRIPAVVDLGEAMLFSALTSRIELQVELSASGAVLKYYNY